MDAARGAKAVEREGTIDEMFAAHRLSLESVARYWARFLEPELDAGDLINDLYLRLKRAFGNGPEKIYNFEAYAHVALRHIIYDHIRRSHSLSRSIQQVSFDHAEAVPMPEPLSADDALLLEKALRTLERENPTYSEVVSLRFLMGFNYQEIGHQLEQKPSWVKSVAQQAMKRLRSLLKEGEGKRIKVLKVRPEAGINIPRPSEVEIFTFNLIDAALIARLTKTPELIRALDWRAFEYLLAKILEELEYEIELTRPTKDGGVDIFALKKTGPFGPHKYLLQAKRWSRAVGVEPVRELLFLHGHHKVTKSCLATTSRFTNGAWELAREYKWNLELRDYEGLLEWIKIFTTPHLRLGC